MSKDFKDFLCYFSRIMLTLVAIYVTINVLGEIYRDCDHPGCDREPIEDSDYCYLHEPINLGCLRTYNSLQSRNSYGSSSTSNSSSGSGSGKGSSSSSAGKPTSTPTPTPKATGSSGKTTYYDTYDDGYDDIYYDGDYDEDRYSNDRDYADGVDDAFDEFGEDW